MIDAKVKALYDGVLMAIYDGQKELVIKRSNQLYGEVKDKENDNNLVIPFSLLYIVFLMINDDRCVNLEKKIIYELKRTYPDIDSVPVKEYLFKVFDLENNPLEFKLLCYAFSTKDELESKIDIGMQESIFYYFSHSRVPKDLFYTDIEYSAAAYAFSVIFDNKKYHNESPEEVERIKKSTINKYYEKINDNFLFLQLRALFPKNSYSEIDKEKYEFENILFARVLTNSLANNLTQDGYLEPVHFYELAINLYDKCGKFTKSVWAALYLLLKEMSFEQIQYIFSVKSLEQKEIDIIMRELFDTEINQSPYFCNMTREKAFEISTGFTSGEEYVSFLDKRDEADSIALQKLFDTEKTKSSDSTQDCGDNRFTVTSQKNKKAFTQIINEERFLFIQNIQQEKEELTTTQKYFLKALFFMCMWDKASYYIIPQKDVFDVCDDFSISQEKRDLIFNRKIDINTCFSAGSIDSIDDVLNKVTKILGMKETGFDFSFFKFENTISKPHDILTLLYNFSRIERDSMPFLINSINLMRERQLEKMPLYEENKNNQKKQPLLKNQNKLNKIDVSFTIDSFELSLPTLKNMNWLNTMDLDNRVIYDKKIVKFICETDREFIGEEGDKKIDWLKSNIKSLGTLYLYKIRNQHTHYCIDQNIEEIMKPKNVITLLLFLIETSEEYRRKYFSKIEKWAHNNSARTKLEKAPFSTMPYFLVHKFTLKLVRVICAIILAKTDEKDYLQISTSLKFDYNNAGGYAKLKTFLDSSNGTLRINSFILTEKEAEKVKVYCKDYFIPESMYLNVEPLLLELLGILFYTEVSTKHKSIGEYNFLEKYHAESAFYILYLAQHFLNFNDDDKEGKK